MARTDPKRFLHGAVGAGDLDNRPEDVIATKRKLRDMGLYRPPPEGIGDDIDAGLDAAVREFQKRRGLIEDGVLRPGGETERNLVAEETGKGFDPGPSPEEIRPAGSVGEGGKNDRDSVVLIKRAFGALGRYPYDRTRPPSPYIDPKLVDAVRQLQGEAGLHPDGRVDTDGETLLALRSAVKGQRAGQNATQRSAKSRPEETRVAFLPLAAPAAGTALGFLARTAAPHLIRRLGLATGAAAAGAAGQAAKEATRDRRQNYDAIQDSPPTSPPPLPVQERNPRDNMTVTPANKPKLPDRTEFPIEASEKPPVFIFPDQSDELPQVVIVHANRSDKRTEQDTLDLQVEFQRRNPHLKHIGGGYKLGELEPNKPIPSINQLEKAKEVAIPGPGQAWRDADWRDELGNKADPRPGSRFPDLLYKRPDERLVALQTVDGDKNGKPTDNELKAAESLRRQGITVYLVVKSRMRKK